MQISITMRNVKSGQAMRDVILRKIDALDRFFEGASDARVVVEEDGKDMVINVHVTAKRHRIHAEAREGNLGKALDSVVSKCQRQLKKTNEKRHFRKNEVPIKELLEYA